LKIRGSLFIITFIISFIILYFIFLINNYVIPEGYEIPIIPFIGFALIIIGFFYFFIKLNPERKKTYTFKYRGLNENSFKIILVILMIFTFFIDPITFSDIIVDWNQISFLNYFRAVIFLLGGTFIPGSCIFNTLFTNSSLQKRFKIEPFFIKLTFYPIISFTFLGSLTLLLGQLGLIRQQFPFILFLIILLVLIIDLTIQKYRRKELSFTENTEFKVSKNTLFILYFALSIIIITFGMQLHRNYLVISDYYRAISYSSFIGDINTSPIDKFSTSTIYWSYISFAFSALCGIPVVNVNVMFFPFIYLVIFSLYLFIKTILRHFKASYAVLGAILAITFSSIFDIFHYYTRRERAIMSVYNGLFDFWYKSFALTFFIASMALFINIVLTPKFNEKELNPKKKDFLIIFLSAFILIQSFMIHFLPVIPALSLIFLFLVFMYKKKDVIKKYLIYVTTLIGLFFFFDLTFNSYFTWVSVNFLSYFFNFNLNVQDQLFTNKLFIYSLFVYLFLIGFLALNFLIYRIYKKGYFKNLKLFNRFKIDVKFIFQMGSIIFTFFLILDIILNFIRTIRGLHYFTFILHLFFFYSGFVGIIGLYLMYFLYKKNPRIFYILLLWLFFLFSLSISIIILEAIANYPIQSVMEFDYFKIVYWFDRIWDYSIIPLSIFGSIGIIELKKYIGAKINKIRTIDNFKLPLKLVLTSSFIFLILSNTFISGIMWHDFGPTLNNQEAQVSGWVCTNIPRDSNILVDTYELYDHLDLMSLSKTYLINREIEEAFNNYDCWGVSQQRDDNCSIVLLEEFAGFSNVLGFNDNNNSGKISILAISDSVQEFGSIKFNKRTTNSSKHFWVNISSFEGIIGISLAIMDEGFYFLNGSNYHKIKDIENDTWYECNLNFECTSGSYSGLTQNSWNVEINGTLYGNFEFLNDIDNIRHINFSSSMIEYDYSAYINNLHFSWAPNFKLENCLYKYLIAFDHLGREEIYYYIHSKIETEYNTIAKDYIDIDNDLISKFYKNKLYEYQDLVIYSTNF